ncbi:MAG TPA: hypothetical protein VMZ92_16605 [Planctomycetota bacterium]|nr:hypothetical protein [Planctomycetota bacterium]
MSKGRAALTDLVQSALLALRTPAEPVTPEGDRAPPARHAAVAFHLPSFALALGERVFGDVDADADDTDGN